MRYRYTTTRGYIGSNHLFGTATNNLEYAMADMRKNAPNYGRTTITDHETNETHVYINMKHFCAWHNCLAARKGEL